MMYLKHFGLNEPPFKITPVTNFFFSGANRGEILDALVYAISGSEGIIKVTGEVGSGKTMLCRMLLERLPLHVEPVYLANPSLSREEMLYAIADSFGLNLERQRVNVILQTIQNLLEQKLKEGKRVVILVDEAHAMPLDTLEELRLLYNLQVGDHKLLQIVLFGQPELDEKLNQPNMRQLKDRIVHHFTMQPLTKSTIESYLMFRMRAAGFRGSNIFSAKALTLIGNASQGWLRRINILADKALLAAFVEDTNSIEAHHVQAAIRDSDFGSKRSRRSIAAVAVGATVIVLMILAGILWSLDVVHPDKMAGAHRDSMAATATLAAANTQSATATPPAAAMVPAAASEPGAATTSGTATPPAANAQPPAQNQPLSPATEAVAEKPVPKTSEGKTPPNPPGTLLQQRLDATRALLSSQGNNGIGIQLFYTTRVDLPRMERFLRRARKLGALDQIYVLPVKIKNGKGFRVFYGVYPTIDAANSGMRQLPPSYKKSYAPTLFIFGASQSAK
jgi:MSHA biogenesis protein MshM